MVVAGLIPQTARFPDGARARGCETARLVASPPFAATRVVALGVQWQTLYYTDRRQHPVRNVNNYGCHPASAGGCGPRVTGASRSHLIT